MERSIKYLETKKKELRDNAVSLKNSNRFAEAYDMYTQCNAIDFVISLLKDGNKQVT